MTQEDKIIIRYLLGYAVLGALKAAAALGVCWLVLNIPAWISEHFTDAAMLFLGAAAWIAWLLWLWKLYRHSLKEGERKWNAMHFTTSMKPKSNRES